MLCGAISSVFGGGLVAASEDGQATEDFGSRGGVPIPAVPAATVFVRTADEHNATWDWQLMLNYYDGQGRAPSTVQAVVDGKTYTLTRASGSPTWGTWKTVVNTPGWAAGASPPLWCKPVHFNVTRNDGATFRYPDTGEIGMGFQPGCDLRGPLPAPPTVTIDGPASGSTVSGAVQIRAHATDDMRVARVEVYIDGKRVIRKSGSSVDWKWNTTLTKWGRGPHTIVVNAYDAFGIEGSTSEAVRT